MAERIFSRVGKTLACLVRDANESAGSQIFSFSSASSGSLWLHGKVGGRVQANTGEKGHYPRILFLTFNCAQNDSPKELS